MPWKLIGQKKAYGGTYKREPAPYCGGSFFNGGSLWSYRLQSYYKKQVHNAAAGLARAGKYEQALKLADFGWKGVQEKKLMQLAHSNLCYVCFIGLGRQEDAETEYSHQKQLVKNHPQLKRIGEAMLLLSEIRKAYTDQKFGQVEAM